MAGVEGRLAAADLSRLKLDLEARLAQQQPRVDDGVGKNEVAEAGGEQLHGGRHRRQNLTMDEIVRGTCL